MVVHVNSLSCPPFVQHPLKMKGEGNKEEVKTLPFVVLARDEQAKVSHKWWLLQQLTEKHY